MTDSDNLIHSLYLIGQGEDVLMELLADRGMEAIDRLRTIREDERNARMKGE